jgi:hypothetical protein
MIRVHSNEADAGPKKGQRIRIPSKERDLSPTKRLQRLVDHNPWSKKDRKYLSLFCDNNVLKKTLLL